MDTQPALDVTQAARNYAEARERLRQARAAVLAAHNDLSNTECAYEDAARAVAVALDALRRSAGPR